MGHDPGLAVERAMKVQEVILRAASGQIQWWQAAEIIGVSVRSMRRWKERYAQHGYDGLFDRRRQQPSPQRVPLATLERVLRLYRERYFDFNVRHFHEVLHAEHAIALSYSWVKTALQTAGLVPRARRRGPHRKRRERRPLPGMLLHLDASRHAWVPGALPLDLVSVSDDATNTVYYAALVDEENTRTVMAALRAVIATPRGLLRALHRPRRPFHSHAAGRPGPPSDASRTGAPAAGHRSDCRPLPPGARAQRAPLRHAPGALAAGAARAGDYDGRGGKPLVAGGGPGEFQPPVSGVARAVWHGLSADHGRSRSRVLDPARPRSLECQHRATRQAGPPARPLAVAVPRCALSGRGARALGRDPQRVPGPACDRGALRPTGSRWGTGAGIARPTCEEVRGATIADRRRGWDPPHRRETPGARSHERDCGNAAPLESQHASHRSLEISPRPRDSHIPTALHHQP